MSDKLPPVLPKIGAYACPTDETHTIRAKVDVGVLIKRIGFVVGPLLFALAFVIPPFEGMNANTWFTAALAAWMIIWWMTEALPLSATALLPTVIFPLMEIMSIKKALIAYANPVIFLFLGGFIIAIALEKTNLHLRLALNIIKAIGTKPSRMLAGFMVAAAFLSMWISNTATMLMMLPIALSVVKLMDERLRELGQSSEGFATALLLGIAYASSVGGIGTLIGTPPNAIMSGFMQQSFNVEIDFFQWMMAGIPVVIVFITIMWWVMSFIMFKLPNRGGASSAEMIMVELKRLGKMKRPEITVACIACFTAFLWVAKPLINEVIPFDVHDSVIAMMGALLLFMVPTHTKNHEFAITWKDAEKLPWGVLILFGGGLSLAAGFQASGLAEWISSRFSSMQGYSPLLLMIIVTALIQIVTTIMSNVASINIFLPILIPMAIALHIHPMYLVIPATMAASCAFMLPVSTANNAIAFSTGRVSIGQMVKMGFWFNLISLPLLIVMMHLVIMPVFDINPTELPAWTNQ